MIDTFVKHFRLTMHADNSQLYLYLSCDNFSHELINFGYPVINLQSVVDKALIHWSEEHNDNSN